MILTILATIFVFGLLVIFHELGHFVTAKLTGMRVDEFAIGFGPKLLSHKYGETVYSLRVFPLGGFNNISGMDAEDQDAGDRAYYAKPIWARMVVILAGSFMNFLLPIVLFCGIFFFAGVSTPSAAPVLGSVMANKPAAEAGLQAGDVISAINGQEMSSWQDIVDTLQDGGGKVFHIDYMREGEAQATTLIPVYDNTAKRAMVGIISSADIVHPSLGESVSLALQKTGAIIYSMIAALKQIFFGESAADLAGPLGVAQMAGEVAQLGFVPLLNFAAFLSLNLGIINLFPIPALDGGHFVALAIEGVRGKPLSVKSLHYAQITGIVLLLALMVFATMNDITR